jgi:hypothetical protein
MGISGQLDSSRRAPLPPDSDGHGSVTVPRRVGVLREDASDRAELESFIRTDFARVYGADVRHFMPHLMGLRGDDGTLLAALGFRAASGGRLFLEHYLDAPVETVLAEAGRQVPRAGIVEVGNLAVSRAGGARWLITALTAYLEGARYQWVVFTGVPALINSFARMGIELLRLAPADRARLPADDQALWGSYYEAGPAVVAVAVAQAFDALTAWLDLPRDRHRLAPLWGRAYAAGLAVGYA